MYKKIRFQAANILTFINLIFGLCALLFTVQEKYHISLIFIVIAALTDRFDGLVARKLKIESKIGKYLDSNSDLISFGVTPALFIYLSVLEQLNILGIIVIFIFVMCGTYRLAKYNAVEFDGFYVGLPITIAGALLALSFLLKDYVSPYIILSFTALLSFSMVCNLKIKKR